MPLGKEEDLDQATTHSGSLGTGPVQGVTLKMSSGVTIPLERFRNLIRTTALA